jgi:hypothetical protein
MSLLLKYNALKHRTYFLGTLCLDSHTVWKVLYDTTIHGNDTTVYESRRLAHHRFRLLRTENINQKACDRCVLLN